MLLINTVPLDCINQAAIQYHVPGILILSVLKTEGGYTGLAKLNHNRSVDYGAFQINSYWIPKLIQCHITQNDLQYDPCVNVKIGAWILSKNIADNSHFQQSIGNYNSVTPSYNAKYFYRVKSSYNSIMKSLYG